MAEPPARHAEEDTANRKSCQQIPEGSFVGRRQQQPDDRGNTHHPGGYAEQERGQRRRPGTEQPDRDRADPSCERRRGGSEEEDEKVGHVARKLTLSQLLSGEAGRPHDDVACVLGIARLAGPDGGQRLTLELLSRRTNRPPSLGVDLR